MNYITFFKTTLLLVTCMIAHEIRSSLNIECATVAQALEQDEQGVFNSELGPELIAYGGPSLLMKAVSLGRLWAVEKLLRSGVSAKITDANGYDPLAYALIYGSEDLCSEQFIVQKKMVELLLENGADAWNPNIQQSLEEQPKIGQFVFEYRQKKSEENKAKNCRLLQLSQAAARSNTVAEDDVESALSQLNIKEPISQHQKQKTASMEAALPLAKPQSRLAKFGIALDKTPGVSRTSSPMCMPERSQLSAKAKEFSPAPACASVALAIPEIAPVYPQMALGTQQLSAAQAIAYADAQKKKRIVHAHGGLPPQGLPTTRGVPIAIQALRLSSRVQQQQPQVFLPSATFLPHGPTFPEYPQSSGCQSMLTYAHAQRLYQGHMFPPYNPGRSPQQ